MEVLIVRGRNDTMWHLRWFSIHSKLHDEVQVEDSTETPRNGVSDGPEGPEATPCECYGV